MISRLRVRSAEAQAASSAHKAGAGARLPLQLKVPVSSHPPLIPPHLHPWQPAVARQSVSCARVLSPASAVRASRALRNRIKSWA